MKIPKEYQDRYMWPKWLRIVQAVLLVFNALLVILAEDPVLTLKWAFYVGDIREGLVTATWREILAFLHQMIFEI